MTRDSPRTFNLHSVYPAAPDLDLVELWRSRGWNFAILDWAQFADTQFDVIPNDPSTELYFAAERRIWSADDTGQLIYRLADGSKHEASGSNVVDILAQHYFAFMNPVARAGLEVRFQGHSLGAQVAIAVAARLGDLSTPEEPLNPAILPTRIALTELVSSNCAKPWLASTATTERSPSLVCPDATVPGDWVGERLRMLVHKLKALPRGVNFEAYRCTPITELGIAVDREIGIFNEMVRTDLKPNTSPFDVASEHQFCMWSYMASLRLPPPQITGVHNAAFVEDSGSLTCRRLVRGAESDRTVGAPSASTPTALIGRESKLAFKQSADSIGPAGLTPYKMRCHDKL